MLKSLLLLSLMLFCAHASHSWSPEEIVKCIKMQNYASEGKVQDLTRLLNDTPCMIPISYSAYFKELDRKLQGDIGVKENQYPRLFACAQLMINTYKRNQAQIFSEKSEKSKTICDTIIRQYEQVVLLENKINDLGKKMIQEMPELLKQVPDAKNNTARENMFIALGFFATKYIGENKAFEYVLEDEWIKAVTIYEARPQGNSYSL